MVLLHRCRLRCMYVYMYIFFYSPRKSNTVQDYTTLYVIVMILDLCVSGRMEHFCLSLGAKMGTHYTVGRMLGVLIRELVKYPQNTSFINGLKLCSEDHGSSDGTPFSMFSVMNSARGK